MIDVKIKKVKSKKRETWRSQPTSTCSNVKDQDLLIAFFPLGILFKVNIAAS